MGVYKYLSTLFIAAAACITAEPLSGSTQRVDSEESVSEPEEPTRGEVVLSLDDYHALRDRVDAVASAAADSATAIEPVSSELVSQQASIDWPVIGTTDGSLTGVDVVSRFVVDRRGDRPIPVFLPVTGFVTQASIEPSGSASLRAAPGGLELVAPEEGSYRLIVDSRAPVDDILGVQRLRMAPLHAPVGEFEIDVSESMVIDVAGAVLAEESSANERRRVRFAMQDGGGAIVEIHRRLEVNDAEDLLADVTVATFVELNQDEALRHDVLAYSVSRGEMGRFAITLPQNLNVLHLETDEGEVPLLIEDGTLTVNRQRMLSGDGYVLVTSQPVDSKNVSLAPMRASVPTRERFLLLTSTVSAQVSPLPESSFRRIDIADVLPETLAASGLEAHAAWRLVDDRPAPSLSVARTEEASPLPTLVLERRTLSLLTDEGVLIHRDRLVLRTSATVLDVKIPVEAELWSTRVDDASVRAVSRDGRVLVPLGFSRRSRTVVELVSVERRNLDEKRSRLHMRLGGVEAPVLTHRWRLLLPEPDRYRYMHGDLEPVSDHAAQWRLSNLGGAHARRISGSAEQGGIGGRITDAQGLQLPGVVVTLSNDQTGEVIDTVTDERGDFAFASLHPGSYSLTSELPGFATYHVESIGLAAGDAPSFAITMGMAAIQEAITVTGESPLIDTRSPGVTFSSGASSYAGGRGSGTRSRATIERDAMAAAELNELREGFSRGVRPIPIDIPESGKLLLLSAALPPASVAVTLDRKR